MTVIITVKCFTCNRIKHCNATEVVPNTLILQCFILLRNNFKIIRNKNIKFYKWYPGFAKVKYFAAGCVWVDIRDLEKNFPI